MPNKTNPKTGQSGMRNFDREAFMYEVADEIRAGLQQDRANKSAAPKQPKPPKKPV